MTTNSSVLQAGCIPIKNLCTTDVTLSLSSNQLQQEVQTSHVYIVLQVFKDSALMAQTNFGSHIATTLQRMLDQEPGGGSGISLSRSYFLQNCQPQSSTLHQPTALGRDHS